MEGSGAGGGGGGAAVSKKKSSKEGEEESLPPGFRFHPTDEELITYYLRGKIADGSFTARAITEVDLNKCEPWDLPEKAKMGEKEWYFFSLRDRKYPTGVRTNRATNAGYWKTTGKDKEIFTGQPPSAQELVGMKKTLVFYKGRAPRGEKSNWVMHEYRLHLKPASKSNKDEWVVCRIFAKSPGVKKYPSSTNAHSRSHHHPYTLDMVPQFLPTLLGHDLFGGGRGHHHPYMTPADLAELSRFARGTPGLHPHIQPHPAGAGYLNPPGPFTLSSLNLNLGGPSPAMPSPHHVLHHAMSMPMGQQQQQAGGANGQAMTMEQHMAAGLGGIPAAGGDGGFGGEGHAAGGAGMRYQNLDVDQMVERYWPGSY
ncbi:hypothetical protein CFC21_072319 [Triticum aestivum]|uniref:NAC domain-containing protein n=2 Tax=Triticum aestivum TaxID=4565 RepID=A0A3B6LPK9_WHEAT|nr:NAC domain-containing protein 92-like [Triticum dicoccoides]XP_044393338.1 NAC domain-containing protein 92-like [Triticum aestivum]KAF7066312.1 hypothetical protein CFC21_072319 [Triticum aestivum]